MKIAAGSFGVFISCFGAHKFYLEFILNGFIMLTVILLTLFILAAINSLIEDIVYLTMGDVEFERVYIIGKKPWF